MVIDKATKTILSKLKKEITALKRQEKLTRNKLRAALVKAKKNARDFQRALERQNKRAQTKIAAAENAVYEKIADVIKKKAKASKKSRTVKRTK